MRSNYLIKGFILMFSAVILTACNKTSIEGSRVQPVPGMPDMQQGFTLESNGKATSINMATLQYESWRQEGNLLILSGQSIGNHQTISFSDTLVLEKVTPESLTIKQNDVSRKYLRSEKEQTKEAISASALAPVQKVLSVKGNLVIGHEVRSFTSKGDTVSYWIVDETEELNQKYDQVTKGIKNSIPIYVELEVIDMGKSNEGFAANYAGVYHVLKINKIDATQKRK